MTTEKLEQISTDSSISETVAVAKPRRGRPPKYAPEARKQKYRESIDKWREEHKEECRTHNKHFYNEHSDQINQYKREQNARAQNALQLLSKMIEDDWENEDLKQLAFDLVKNKKIIYA